MAYGKKWVIRRPEYPILRYFSEFKIRLLLMQKVLQEKRPRDNCRSVNVSNNRVYKTHLATRRFTGFAYDVGWTHRVVSYCE
jgi:hypothetical protein